MNAKMSLAVAALTLVSAPTLRAATLAADYQFQNTLADSLGAAPDLTVVQVNTNAATPTYVTETVDGQPRTVFNFDQGTGVRATTGGVIAADDYSLVTLVRFDPSGVANPLNEFRKVVDFKNRTSDSGLYNLDGFLSFFDSANATSIATATGGTVAVPDTYVQIALTRDGASDLVAAYVDGVPVLSFTDANDLAVIDDPDSTDEFLNFFIDDNINPTVLPTSQFEGSSGSVARIRLFDGALTAGEVANLDRVPEPSSLALLGVGGLALLRRRRGC